MSKYNGGLNYEKTKRILSIIVVISVILISLQIKVKTSKAAGNVESAISWAISIANDNSHGYSQSNRWGNPDYDCSSFVISAFKSAGFNVGAATYTGDMVANFTKSGEFEWITNINFANTSQLKQGDILLNVKNHTEIYLGNNQMVGAHSGSVWQSNDHRYGLRGGSVTPYEPEGDQGGEISVCGYSNSSNWNGVLRCKNSVPLPDPVPVPSSPPIPTYNPNPIPDGVTDVTYKWTNRKIDLQSVGNSKYVVANINSSNASLEATSNESYTWKKYRTTITNDGCIAFKSLANNRYVSVDMNASGFPVVVGSDSINSWEKFRIYMIEGNYYVRSVVDGYWVTPDLNCSNAPLYASGTFPSSWEKFSIQGELVIPNTVNDVSQDLDNKLIRIKSCENNKYLGVKNSGLCADNQIQQSTTFHLCLTSDGYAGLLANDYGQYIGTNLNANGAPVVLSSTNINEWERFKIFKDGNGYYYFLSKADGHWISADVNKSNAPLTASGSEPYGYEKFVIEEIIETDPEKQTAAPTAKSTAKPTANPTSTPTVVPTATPSPTPTTQPSITLSPTPTTQPSITLSPTPAPTKEAVTTAEEPDVIDDNSIAKPGKASITSLKNNSSRAILIKFKKSGDGAGYQIAYRNKKSGKFKYAYTSKKSLLIKNLVKKKTYYCKVRTYVLDGTTKVYGKWSGIKKVKIRK